jgi:hypothetical protein
LARGSPQLPDDFGNLEVAIETLAAGGAERTLQRTADLRRNAQRTAVVLGNENGFHAIVGADIDQPFARTVIGNLFHLDFRRTNFGHCREFLAQRPGNVRHLLEIGHTEMMHPAHQLLGAEWLFAEFGKERGEFRLIVIEQIDERH